MGRLKTTSFLPLIKKSNITLRSQVANTKGEQWQVLKSTTYPGSDPFRSTDISQFMKSHSAADEAYAVFFSG